MFEERGPQLMQFAAAIGALVAAEAVVFILAALLHLGVPLPVGFSEPRILPAFVVETLIGLFFALSAFAVFVRKKWAWGATVGAHVFSIAGISLGMAAMTFSPGRGTEANESYHRVMMAVAVASIILLLMPGAKRALGHTKDNTER